MSPDSVLTAADLGAQMIVFSQRPWADQAEAYRQYGDRYVDRHGGSPKPLLTCDFVYCDEDPVRAEDIAREHIAGYLTSVLAHYELAGDHFKEAKGYESYGDAVDLLKAIGLEQMCDMYLGVQAWGTPATMIDQLVARREIIGDYDLTCSSRAASALPASPTIWPSARCGPLPRRSCRYCVASSRPGDRRACRSETL